MATDGWVLDAGFGTGRIGRALAQHHPRTVGVDLSRAMLLEGQTRTHAPLNLVQADLISLPFADARFDAVLSVHVLHLVRDWKAVLDEIARVLKPEGRLWLGFERRLSGGLTEAFLSELVQEGLLPRHPGATRAEVQSHLRESGWDVREENPYGWNWRARRTVREAFSALEERVYSQLWEVPEAPYQARLDAFRSRTTKTAAESAAVWEEIRLAMSATVATPPRVR